MQHFNLKKATQAFVARRLPTRTTELWVCAAPPCLPRKYDGRAAVLSPAAQTNYFRGMEITMTGIQAMQWARELSKLPDGCFTVAFFPCSRHRGEAVPKLTVREGCKWRAQLPNEAFHIDSDHFFLFTDNEGEPKMCYRILIRYMGFPQDGFKLHKINWL